MQESNPRFDSKQYLFSRLLTCRCGGGDVAGLFFVDNKFRRQRSLVRLFEKRYYQPHVESTTRVSESRPGLVFGEFRIHKRRLLFVK